MNIAIIDDTVEFQEIILQYVQRFGETAHSSITVETYASGEEFLKQTRNYRVDVMILDVELPGKNGVELSRIFRKTHPDMLIIFLTSYEHYMKDAFGLNVHSYILKENLKEDLPRILGDIEMVLNHKESSCISLYTEVGNVDVDEGSIICILYENRKPVLYTRKAGLIVYRHSLNSIFQSLNKALFIQPNSGAIINVKYIQTINKTSVIMKYVDAPIPISRGKYNRVRDLYVQYYMSGESL